MTAMFICDSNGENIPTDTEAYYEAVASQEEIYLEETEEELRAILEFDGPVPPPGEPPNRQRDPAAEEMIIGDSENPPLCEEAVEKILRMA
jgi:hypothetical protein